jgi:hypothetical protein
MHIISFCDNPALVFADSHMNLLLMELIKATNTTTYFLIFFPFSFLLLLHFMFLGSYKLVCNQQLSVKITATNSTGMFQNVLTLVCKTQDCRVFGLWV